MQRALDIVFSLIALIALSWLLIPVALLLKVTGEGEIFFTQTRVGIHGNKFNLFKFATMLKDSPNIGSGTVTLKNDPRVLPLGRYLRQSKINELPQLFNILKGDMSFVGPRPQTQRCFDAFPSLLQDKIVSVPPGLTGVGSIVFRGEEELIDGAENADWYYDEIIMPYKGQLEEWYVRNRSVSLYLKCILATAIVVIKPTSTIVWKFFPLLPEPPQKLAEALDIRYIR